MVPICNFSAEDFTVPNNHSTVVVCYCDAMIAIKDLRQCSSFTSHLHKHFLH